MTSPMRFWQVVLFWGESGGKFVDLVGEGDAPLVDIVH
ncbi:hypothetical protein RISK_004683 [Rhodopirellula islandica]|uniref:Uncharacterized protein n=1 Tax=Rhodopirellula islandica TaxID=595434 RepID=A0A0J1BA51_RHOIS|nr:hypothetical protein RISK_004683 [Rhodopirellula islandica]